MKKFFTILCLVAAFTAFSANVQRDPEPKICDLTVTEQGTDLGDEFVISVLPCYELIGFELNSPIVYGDFIINDVGIVYLEEQTKPPVNNSNAKYSFTNLKKEELPPLNPALELLKLDKLHLCS